MALSGNTAVVGTRRSAYVFERTCTGWSRRATFTGNDDVDEAAFGISVAVAGNTAVVGAPEDWGRIPGEHAGAAYVYERSGGTWQRQARLVARQSREDGQFGKTVAVEGDSILVDAGSEDDDWRRVVLFRRSGESWSREGEISGNAYSTNLYDYRSMPFDRGRLVFGDSLVPVTSGRTNAGRTSRATDTRALADTETPTEGFESTPTPTDAAWPPDTAMPISAPYGIDCGGEVTEGTVTVDGVGFQPVPAVSRTIDITELRRLREDEAWWRPSVRTDPLPRIGHTSFQVFGEVGGAPPETIKNTDHPELYHGEYWAEDEFSMAFAVENGTYDVTVHLAEVFYASEGERVFSVTANGEPVVDELDLVAEVGYGVAMTPTLEGVEVTDNTLIVTATSSVENPKLSGIELRSA